MGIFLLFCALVFLYILKESVILSQDIHFLGIDEIYFARATRNEKIQLIGKKIREHIGLCLWDVAQCVAACENKKGYASFLFVMWQGYPDDIFPHDIHDENNQDFAKGIASLARDLISHPTQERGISIIFYMPCVEKLRDNKEAHKIKKAYKELKRLERLNKEYGLYTRIHLYCDKG